LCSRHDVTAVASVDAAVRELDDRSFDAILCDVMMPDRTGLDMHAHLARARPDLLRRIVFMSGGAFTPALQAFFEQFDGVRLDKPVREPDLAKAIELAAAA
jgi:CheY-like chemotaxis protein